MAHRPENTFCMLAFQETKSVMILGPKNVKILATKPSLVGTGALFNTFMSVDCRELGDFLRGNNL
jgi:hypothetical protein